MDFFGDFLEDVAGSAIEKLIQFLAGWMIQVLTEMLNFVGTWWLKIGAPSMGAGSATERVQQSTLFFVGVAGVIGTAFALIKLARDQDRASTENLLMGMVRTVLTTALAVPMVGLLFGMTDVLAPWLVTTISGSAQEDGLGQAMGLEALAGTTMTLYLAGLVLFITPLALIGAIINAVLVIFSYGMAIALCGILPIFAAASQTERGRKSFDKAVGWLAAVVLFKPVAAILYGAGLALMKGINGTADSEIGNTVIGLLTGLVIITSACIAMPALAKVLVPAVSAGPQGMGASGLAMLGGAVALGAVTGGLGAAAGASAAGGGGAAAMTGGGAATATTAATATEATGTAGAAATGRSGSSASLAGGGSEATGAASSGGSTAGTPSTGGDPASTNSGQTAGAGGSGPSGAEPKPQQSSAPVGDSGTTGSAGGGGSGGPSGAEQRPEQSGAQTPLVSDAGESTGANSGASGGNTSTGGGPSGAAPQTAGSGAPTEAPTGAGADTPTAGGPSGAESDTPGNRAPAEAPTGSGADTPTAGGPSGAESATPGNGTPTEAPGSASAPSGSTSPSAEGYRAGAPSGADKAAQNRQRIEYALRDAAKDMERAVESGNDS